MKELIEIQSELKAPKGQFNKFGNFKYRSCEDILEALKPLLKKTGTALIMTDEIRVVADRFYIEAVVKLFKGEVSVTVKGLAREPESRKGMDSAQITGATSSYARKYALSGLFAIDDNKDTDHSNGDSQPDPAKKEKLTPPVEKNPEPNEATGPQPAQQSESQKLNVRLKELKIKVDSDEDWAKILKECKIRDKIKTKSEALKVIKMAESIAPLTKEFEGELA